MYLYSLAQTMEQNQAAFENLVLPKGFNIANFKQQLRLRYGALSVDNPFDFVDDVRAWFLVNYRSIEQLTKLYSTEYNPLENYDRVEDSTVSSTSRAFGKGKATSGEKSYDSDSFKDTERSDSESESEGSGVNKTVSRIHGNIGITTSAQMAHGEIDLYTNHNLYKDVARMFAAEFLIMSYGGVV